jgi:AraC-like DNA-binding protein
LLNNRLAIVRATHLNDYIAVLRQVGAPVDRNLARSRLPPRIEETPDLYVSVPVAIEWLAKSGRDLELMELGFLGAQQATLGSLSPSHQAAIMAAPPGLRRLEALARVSRLENSAVEARIQWKAHAIRFICDMAGLQRHPFVCLSEWLNLQAVVSVVRSFAGPTWCPSELCFVSANPPPQGVLAAFPNTRILVGQPHTCVVIERAALARTYSIASASAPLPAMESGVKQASQPATWEFAGLLRKLVQPYLNEGRPDVAFAAELAGVSTRTLQRRLMLCGSSYSQILSEARIELACARLADPALKVIDIAMMTGYGSPQHFTRAFRRFRGLTPSEYRLHNFGGDAAIYRR